MGDSRSTIDDREPRGITSLVLSGQIVLHDDASADGHVLHLATRNQYGRGMAGLPCMFETFNSEGVAVKCFAFKVR